MNESQIWRGITFRVHSEPRGFERWIADEDPMTRKPMWKAVRYHADGIWYARLRVGAHRFEGEGNVARLALDECRKKARALIRQVNGALP